MLWNKIFPVCRGVLCFTAWWFRIPHDTAYQLSQAAWGCISCGLVTRVISKVAIVYFLVAPVRLLGTVLTQRLQYPLIMEDSLNHIRDPYYKLRYIP